MYMDEEIWDDDANFIRIDGNQGKYSEINVGHTNFQPTWISHPH
jgi:hypothetical protein